MIEQAKPTPRPTMPENIELPGFSERGAKLMAWALVLSLAGAFVALFIKTAQGV